MSINIYDISYRNENNELKTQEELLLEYFNLLVKKCRKTTKGKSYDELDNGDTYDRFQNRLGHFEKELDYIIRHMINQISYLKHKEELKKLQETNCLYSWDYTENPMDDLNTYVKCLRKKLKAIIKIYSQHKIKEDLIAGYYYYTL